MPVGALERVARLPAPLLRPWRRVARRWRRWAADPARLVAAARRGPFWRVAPLRRNFGVGAGQPIDRYYIESFLAEHAGDVRGRVLEVADDTYTRRFGGERVTCADVLHVRPGHPGATIIADLTAADHIPSDTFDCVILTQVLQFVFDTRAVLHTAHRILRPGGTLLATIPCTSRISTYDEAQWGEFWRVTSMGAGRLFGQVFPADGLEVRAYGNILTAVAAMHGVVTAELSRHELDHRDPDFEVLIAVRAVKATAVPSATTPG